MTKKIKVGDTVRINENRLTAVYPNTTFIERASQMARALWKEGEGSDCIRKSGFDNINYVVDSITYHEIDGKDMAVIVNTEHRCSFVYVLDALEVVDDYRPYENTSELISDFNKRLASSMDMDEINMNELMMPVIWVADNEDGKILMIQSYFGDSVKIDGVAYTMSELYDGFTYCDGTPVGKSNRLEEESE